MPSRGECTPKTRRRTLALTAREKFAHKGRQHCMAQTTCKWVCHLLRASFSGCFQGKRRGNRPVWGLPNVKPFVKQLKQTSRKNKALNKQANKQSNKQANRQKCKQTKHSRWSWMCPSLARLEGPGQRLRMSESDGFGLGFLAKQTCFNAIGLASTPSLVAPYKVLLDF